MSNPYQEGFYRIADHYSRMLQEKGESILRAIAECPSVRSTLLEVYHQLVKDGRCTPIENLSPEEKRELFNEAKRLGATETKVIIQVCKGLQALGSYIEGKKK